MARARRGRNTSRSASCVGNLRVIKDGLAADDKIIVNGMARVRPGQKVNTAAAGRRPAQPAAGAAPAAAAK